MKKITKRDIKFFFLGVMSLFILEVIWDWDAHVTSFKKGWDEAHQKAEVNK